MAQIIVGTIAFLINIPFGQIRAHHPKFSLGWLFWIHASIPVLIYLRITLHVSNYFIPANIALAVAGQLIGSRIERKRLTAQQEI